ncbi:hypothetical protein NIB75_12835 [Bacteroides uniformis]|nr:hypothetical protein [Bacteroides uniformis]
MHGMQRSGNLHVLRMLNSGYQLLPMREVYFHPAIDVWQDMLQRGNLPQLHLLALVAVLILIVGIFNFMSLYTVVLLKRSKEFRLKKVFGNNSAQLFSQLYIENLCLTLVSLFIAWFLVEISVFPLNKYFDVIQQPNGIFDIGITIAIPDFTAIDSFNLSVF